MVPKHAGPDEEPGWLRTVVSALVQGLIRAVADVLLDRGGRGL
jgi:hypothetical protein